MVLFGDMSLTPFGTAPKDMDYVGQQQFARDKILGLFRVPKAVVAQTENASFAAAKTAQYAFAKWTIQPKMERLIQQLNEFFVPLFPNSENLYLDYNNPIPEDDSYQLQLFNSGIQNGWMTVNEVRAMYNLDSVDGGDELRSNTTLNPLGLSMPLSGRKVINKKLDHSLIRKKTIRGAYRTKKYFEFQKVKAKALDKIKDSLRKEVVNLYKQKTVNAKKKSAENIDTKQWSIEKKSEFWHAKDKVYSRNVIKVFKIQAKNI
jgi:hypothetical protein